GIGLDYIPATLSFEHVSDAVSVTDAEAYAAARKLTRIEGIFTGGSSGTALAGAIKWILGSVTPCHLGAPLEPRPVPAAHPRAARDPDPA
ncbi:MAG: hypothetical protein IIC01_07525, partial [Planctomycetes bacterium]|nr:hypothetical protein [Planctomycetota bacterium]